MPSRRVRAEIERSRSFRGFAELCQAHWVILENAKTKRDGWLYECLTANILAAFKMEAYFNHSGLLLFANWDKIERGLSKRKKLDKILAKIGLVRMPDDERLATLESLFELRDGVAHARTQELSQSVTVEEGDIEELRRRKPLTKWEALSTIKFATLAYEHTESLIEEIHAAAGFDPADLHRSGHSYSLRVLATLA
jgi:hypothetical protein